MFSDSRPSSLLCCFMLDNIWEFPDQNTNREQVDLRCHLCGIRPSGLRLGCKECKGQRLGRDVGDLRSRGLSSSVELLPKDRGTRDQKHRWLQEGGQGRAGPQHCGTTSKWKRLQETPWLVGHGLGAGQGCVGAERILQAALLHHRHPENKCKQRDPALQEPPTQPPPQRHYPMPSKSKAATNLGPLDDKPGSIMLATSDSYLPLVAERSQGTVCIVCCVPWTVLGGAITLPLLVAKQQH